MLTDFFWTRLWDKQLGERADYDDEMTDQEVTVKNCLNDDGLFFLFFSCCGDPNDIEALFNLSEITTLLASPIIKTVKELTARFVFGTDFAKICQKIYIQRRNIGQTETVTRKLVYIE